jgi:hypothetical protein
VSHKGHLLSVLLFIGLAMVVAAVFWSGLPIDTSGGARLIKDLQAGLDANPRVVEAKVGGYEDLDGQILSDVKVMEATFRLRGRQDATVTIERPRRNLLTGGDGRISLMRIGRWVLVENREGGRHSTITRGVDVSVNGDLAGSLPFGIANVNDLIDHYDDLLNYLNRMPERRTIFSNDGNTWIRNIRREP